MKLVIISFDEPFFIPLLFKPLLKSYPELIKAVIIIPQTSGRKESINFVKKQLSMAGPTAFVIKSFKYLIFRVGTILGIFDKSLASLARKRNVSLFYTSGVNDRKTVEILKKMTPDYVITQVPEKIESNILKFARVGFINKHASLLPKYKGLYPIFWALLNDEKNIGFTFHFMDKNIDSGNILYQEKIPIESESNVYELYNKVFVKAGKALVIVVSNLNKNTIKLRKMKKGGSYYSIPRKKDIKKFHRKGLSYL